MNVLMGDLIYLWNGNDSRLNMSTKRNGIMTSDWVYPQNKIRVDKICLQVENTMTNDQVSPRYIDTSMTRETFLTHDKKWYILL